MKAYLDLLSRIYHSGIPKHPHRKESGRTKHTTLGLPNLHFSHDLSAGFPLLTTRKMPWKNIVGELRSFLEGHTNNKDFVRNGCNFWNSWARPDGDLGPIYGAQWNKYGQLQHVLDSLCDNPTDRRMVVSAWRPDEHHLMVLPPCHVQWIATVYDNKLYLSWHQRSCDFPVGVPCNIASYALLCHILASWADLEPGGIDCIFVDSHIYNNQIESVRQQLCRNPDPLPYVSVWFEAEDDFNSWDVALYDYEPQPPIKFGELEV